MEVTSVSELTVDVFFRTSVLTMPPGLLISATFPKLPLPRKSLSRTGGFYMDHKAHSDFRVL